LTDVQRITQVKQFRSSLMHQANGGMPEGQHLSIPRRLCERLCAGRPYKQRTYRLRRQVLHGTRRHLNVDEAARREAQRPVLVAPPLISIKAAQSCS